MLPRNDDRRHIRNPAYREKVPHQKQHLMKDKKICISCKKCGLQYVGETENALHIRMNGHGSNIRKKKTEKEVAAHFCQLDQTVEDLQVKETEKIHRSSTQWRRERERERASRSSPSERCPPTWAEPGRKTSQHTPSQHTLTHDKHHKQFYHFCI